MAYDFLNTTTYATDPLAQGDFSSFLPSSPIGSGAELTSFDSDLIEMVVTDEQEEAENPNQDIVEAPALDDSDFGAEPDDRADMELLNMLFEEEPAAPQRVRSYRSPDPVEPEPEEDETNNHTYRNGKVAPRIWQYGGEPSKYQVGGEAITLYKPQDTRIINIEDKRTLNPVTGKPLSSRERKSVKVNEKAIQNIVNSARASGVDPYTALAVSYQESAFSNGDKLFNLNPNVFGKPFGNADEGVKNLQESFNYARNLQNRGVVPQGEEFYLQGNNGYGRIKRGHLDLEGANSIYGVPIPDEGINFKKNPYYGQTVMSLRDSVLRQNPQITDLINKAPSKQFGGTLYADDYETQRIGLNDPNFNNAILNLKGTNTIRGLDNHQPVAVTDGSKYEVLHGPQDTAKFKGKVYEKKLKMQTGGEAGDLEKEKLFYERYIQSDKYKERLTKQGYGNVEDIINSRLTNVRNTQSERTGSGGSYYDPTSRKVLLDTTDPFYKYYPETVKSHEVGHAAGAVRFGNPNFKMNATDSSTIAERNKPIQGHDSRPHEFKADMDTLRYLLRKDRIYDASTQDFTPEVLEKVRNKYKGDPAVERLLRNAKSDEDLIYLMNTIAQNNTNNNEVYG